MRNMTSEENNAWHRKLNSIADTFMDEALAKGDPFTEGLCSWAIDRALEKLGPGPLSEESSLAILI